MTSEAQEREAFVKWWEENGPGMEEYAQYAREAWLARASLSTPEAVSIANNEDEQFVISADVARTFNEQGYIPPAQRGSEWESSGTYVTVKDMSPADLQAMLSTPEAAGVPEGWKMVPEIGALVSSSHPRTCLNPEEFFTVIDVKRETDGRYFVRGEKTCWFGLSMISPAAPPFSPPLSAPVGVKVKELEWEHCHAESIFGGYTVERTRTAFGLVLPGDEDRTFPYSFRGNEAQCKAAAQADYEQRILSALTSTPKGVDAVQVVREMRAKIYPNEDGTHSRAALNILAGSEDGHTGFNQQLWRTRVVLAHLGIPDTFQGEGE